MNSVLKRLGWNESLENSFDALSESTHRPGRVTTEHKDLYRVHTSYGEFLARVSGRMRHEGFFPAVGDWVVLSAASAGSEAAIHGILPRKSKFSRKVAGSEIKEQVVAANVDTVFIVSSLNGDFNPRRLERYITVAWDSGADPVIVLSKSDLCGDISEKLETVERIAFGMPVHIISSLTEDGIDGLRGYFSEGRTVAMIGSSGVGKSTLINAIAGEELLETGEIRKDGKGRHTTTHRELILLKNGGAVIDTPGMRELQLWEGGNGLAETFSDVEDIARNCRFTDCRHEEEPGCAVKAAIKEGTLEEERLVSYRKLLKELKYIESKKEKKERKKKR